MKFNKLRKIISGAAAAVVFAAVVPGLSLAGDTDVSIHIEGEEGCSYAVDYMDFSVDDNAVLSGEKFGNIRTLKDTVFNSDTAVFSYSFNTDIDGWYSLSFTASKYNNTNYSSYAVSVDDGEFVRVENGTTATKTADIGTDNVFATYKMNSGYMLSAGEHTLSFKMLDTGTRTDGRGYVFVDCADFTLTQSIPGLTVKGDDPHTISSPAVSLYSELQGETSYPVFKTANGVECPEEGVEVKYTFNAPKSGLYNLSISANQYNGGLSTYAVAVNGSGFVPIDAASVSGQQQLELAVYAYETNINFEVNEGMNTITFKILTGRAADNRLYCFLNYMQLTEVEVHDYAVVKGTDAHTSNSETINGNYADSASEMPGALVIKTLPGQAFPDEGVIVSYNMYVPADGLYRMSIAANAHSSDMMSNYAVSLNGGEFKAVNASNAGSSAKPNGGMSNVNEKVIGIYDTTEIYSLEKGQNTVAFKLTSPRPSDGRGYAALEYIKFTPEETVGEHITIGGTDTHGLNVTPAETIGESVGERYAYNALELYASKESFESTENGLAASYVVNAEKAGYYRLTIAASEFADKAWLSPYSISVNGGGYTAVNKENAGSASDPNGGWDAGYMNVNADASQQQVIGIYETDIVLSLNEGINTVSFKVDGLTGNGNNAIAALAWMKLDITDAPIHTEAPTEKPTADPTEKPSDEPIPGGLEFGEPYFSGAGAEWSVKNNGTEEAEMILLYAVYDDSGVLVSCELKPLKLAAGGSAEATFLGGGNHMKLFAWNKAMVPLTNVQASN